MKNYPVKDIQVNSFFSKPLFLGEGFILAAPETPVTAETLKALREWEFREVFSDGEPREAYFSEDVD